MQLNGTDLVDRHNRPNLSSKTGLRVFFYNDGQPVDPYAFSGVTVFEKTANLSPNSVIDSNNVVASTVVSTDIKAHFGTSINAENLSNSALPESEYEAGASGIFKVATGEYVVVLDGQNPPVAAYNYHGAGLQVTSTANY